jgi:hypothetical protein
VGHPTIELRRRQRRYTVTIWFQADNAVLTVAQAVCVALPAAGLPAWLAFARRGAWTLVLPLSIIVCVAVIGLIPASADVYTWAALILVPIGAALALGWAMHGARWALAPLAAALLAVAWIWQDAWTGELATDLLILLSTVTLGRLLAGAASLTLVKLALVAMAIVDAILVFSGELAGPNATLVAAVPAPGLPQLQAGVFHFSSLGYGDFLAAAVLGGILAIERAPQWRWALVVLLVSFAWEQLFLVVDLLPATVPPAIVLVLREAIVRYRTRPSSVRMSAQAQAGNVARTR